MVYKLLPFHGDDRGDDGIWIWEHECGDLPMDLDEEVCCLKF